MAHGSTIAASTRKPNLGKPNCSLLGNPIVANLEWIKVPLTVTSKQVRRPTMPETAACGTCLQTEINTK